LLDTSIEGESNALFEFDRLYKVPARSFLLFLAGERF